MVDIMSLTKMGGQVALTVTPEDLHHGANALLAPDFVIASPQSHRQIV